MARPFSPVVSIRRADVALLAEGLQRLEFELEQERLQRREAQASVADLQSSSDHSKRNGKPRGRSEPGPYVVELEEMVDMLERDRLSTEAKLAQRDSDLREAAAEM